MPPALLYSDDEGEGDDGLFAPPKEHKSRARAPATNGAGRTTRANTASTKAPQTALGIASGTALTGDGYNDDEDEEEEYEDDDDDTADADSGGFLSKPKLPSHQFASRSLSDITQLLSSPYLDLNPEYQRDVVWKRNRMSGLIDSLMENFYVPPVIFNVQAIKAEDGTERWRRTCVDGKQRLTSIRDFMKGRIPCHDRRGATWHYCAKEDEDGNTVRSAGRRILPEKIKEDFRNKQLVCYEFMNLTDAQERDLFQRVQKGVQLTKAEQFRATKGEWQSFAEMYERDFPKVVNLAANSRASGFRNILTCFSQVYECQDPSAANGVPLLRSSVGALDSFLSNEPALNSKTRDHLRHVFTMFNDLVEEDPQTFRDNGYRRVKTFAPIELVSVAVLISQHGLTRPRGMLLGDIRALRDHLRSTNRDLRMNKDVWFHAWDFIDDLEGQRGTVDGSTALKKIPKPRQKRSVKAGAVTMQGKPGKLTAAEPVPSGPVPPSSDDAQSKTQLVTVMPPANMIDSAAAGLSERHREADRHAATTAGGVREGLGHAAIFADHDIAHGPRDTSPSTSPSAASVADSLLGSAPPTERPGTLKRRPELDLGSGSTGARALAAKKARLLRK